MTPALRARFPLLARRLDGWPLVYLDSAATALKPEGVLAAERAYSTEYTANVHRGHSALAEEATHAYESARRRIARFIKADPASVVLTPNTTYAIEIVASGLGLDPADTVLCSPSSHHSLLVPFLRRARVAYCGADPLAPLDPDEVSAALRAHRPALLAVSWVSNVSGVVSPLAEICRRARDEGVPCLVDAAQAAPHLPIDVTALGCDFLAFSGHKVMGPTGTGVLWGRPERLAALEPLVLGGGVVDRVRRDGYKLKPLPYRLEPGTPHISGAIGLGAAVDFLEELGFERVAAHERALVQALDDCLRDLPGVRRVDARGGVERVAIASLAPLGGGMHSDMLCQILSDSFKVMTRSGFHCAHPLFDGLELAAGAVRLSAYLYNTVEEIYAAAAALRAVLGRVGLARAG
jgi:cysteine desulfurase/selenocysteine lyase